MIRLLLLLLRERMQSIGSSGWRAPPSALPRSLKRQQTTRARCGAGDDDWTSESVSMMMKIPERERRRTILLLFEFGSRILMTCQQLMLRRSSTREINPLPLSLSLTHRQGGASMKSNFIRRPFLTLL